MPTQLRDVLDRHLVLTFALMGLCFVAFALTSYNLVVLLMANLNLFFLYGWSVASDGALQQLLELTGYGYLSLALYLAFKFCEHILVEHVSGKSRTLDIHD